MANEIKKRNLWKEKEIEMMILLIKENHILKLMDSKIKRNKTIFTAIEKEMKERGFYKTSEQIRTKFKSLKSEYYKTKRNNNTSGAQKQTCPYYELLDEILSCRPVVTVDGVDTSVNVDISIDDGNIMECSNNETTEQYEDQQEPNFIERDQQIENLSQESSNQNTTANVKAFNNTSKFLLFGIVAYTYFNMFYIYIICVYFIFSREKNL